MFSKDIRSVKQFGSRLTFVGKELMMNNGFCLTSHQQLRSYRDGTIWLKVLSDGLKKPGMEPATPGLQGKWFIRSH